MPITDNATHSPGITILLPDHGKFKGATVVFAIFFVTKDVLGDLNRTEIFDRVYL